MTEFDKTVKAFTRELKELKNAPTRSPSEMVMKTRRITVYPTIVGAIDGSYLSTSPKKYGVAKIVLDEPGFATHAIVTDGGQRRFFYSVSADNSDKVIGIYAYGSPQDASDLNGNPSNEKTLSVELEITATCDFTLTQYQTEDF